VVASPSNASVFLATSRRLTQFSTGRAPGPADTVVYISGSWDLFNVGHIKALEKVSYRQEHNGCHWFRWRFDCILVVVVRHCCAGAGVWQLRPRRHSRRRYSEPTAGRRLPHPQPERTHTEVRSWLLVRGCLCMCACVYVCVHVCVCVAYVCCVCVACVYVRVCMCAYAWCMCVCVCVFMCVRICVRVCTCASIQTTNYACLYRSMVGEHW
jgi:hypothetical protein